MYLKQKLNDPNWPVNKPQASEQTFNETTNGRFLTGFVCYLGFRQTVSRK